MDREQFREVGHKVIDWIADYHDFVGNLKINPGMPFLCSCLQFNNV